MGGEQQCRRRRVRSGPSEEEAVACDAFEAQLGMYAWITSGKVSVKSVEDRRGRRARFAADRRNADGRSETLNGGLVSAG
jgi:hypothetical protein